MLCTFRLLLHFPLINPFPTARVKGKGRAIRQYHDLLAQNQKFRDENF